MLNERDLELIGGVVTKAMEPVREEVKELRADVTKLQVDVEELQTGMEKLSTEVERLGRKTEKIEFIMENELRPNICKIAEGHLDLSRKLDMVRVRRSEYTLLDIKVSGLQLDIREIRDKLKIA